MMMEVFFYFTHKTGLDLDKKVVSAIVFDIMIISS